MPLLLLKCPDLDSKLYSHPILSHRPDLIPQSWLPTECEGVLGKLPSSLARPAPEGLPGRRLDEAGLGDVQSRHLGAWAAHPLNLESEGGLGAGKSSVLRAAGGLARQLETHTALSPG